jgi:hypothetical protein
MAVPLTWSIPSGFSDRIMPEGYLGINDATLVRLPSEFRILRGKLVREDRDKASRHVMWFQYRVEEEFWKDLFGKGVILNLVTRDLDPRIRTTAPMMFPHKEVRLLVPKSLPHRLPSAEEKHDAHVHLAFRMSLIETYSDEFYPREPENTDDYDEFVLIDRFYEYSRKYYYSMNDTFVVFLDFESVRKRIQSILF